MAGTTWTTVNSYEAAGYTVVDTGENPEYATVNPVLLIAEVDTVSDLFADTIFTYTAGRVGTVAAGQYIRTRAEGFAYQVAASGATDHHVTTAGGVKLHVVNFGNSVVYSNAIGCRGDGTFDNLSRLNALLSSFTEVEIVPSSEGAIIGISGSLVIPANKTLRVHRSATLRLIATGTNNATAVVRHSNGSKLYCEGKIDGNLSSRESSGELSAGFVFGVISSNVSDTVTNVAEYIEVGCTEADFSANGGNGGAALIEMTASATADVTRNKIGAGKITGSKHGFIARIFSVFNDIQEGELSYYAQFNEIDGIYGDGGRKNCIEIAGPHTRFNKVSSSTAFDPTGQGGFECDFGAYGNVFENCQVSFSSSFVIGRTFSGFNNLSSNIDTKLKLTRDNTYVDCSVLGGTMSSAFSFRGFTVSGVGTGVKFIRPTMRGQSAGSGSGQLIGLLLEATLAKLDNILVQDPTFVGVQFGDRVIGSFGVGSLRILGGSISYANRLHDLPSNSGADLVRLATRAEGTSQAISGTVEKVIDIRDCEFVGQTTTTVGGPTDPTCVLIYGGCQFRCGTSSGVPIISSPGCFLIDDGGNVYTTRIPGNVLSGGDGRSSQRAASHVVSNSLLTNRLQRALVFTSARPSSGTWYSGDAWRRDSPVAATSPGEDCTGSGTYGTLVGVTASTTNGSPIVVVNDATNLRVNQVIQITSAGIAVARILSISGLNVTLSASATSDQTGSVVAYRAPIWKALPIIEA